VQSDSFDINKVKLDAITEDRIKVRFNPVMQINVGFRNYQIESSLKRRL